MRLKLRHFERFCIYLFSLFKNNNCKSLLKMFTKSRSSATRTHFCSLLVNSNFVEFSFVTISTKILNSFLFNQLQLPTNSFKTLLKFITHRNAFGLSYILYNLPVYGISFGPLSILPYLSLNICNSFNCLYLAWVLQIFAHNFNFFS